jgi:hypothetical protein
LLPLLINIRKSHKKDENGRSGDTEGVGMTKRRLWVNPFSHHYTRRRKKERDATRKRSFFKDKRKPDLLFVRMFSVSGVVSQFYGIGGYRENDAEIPG